jgi:hypothetical protein
MRGLRLEALGWRNDRSSPTRCRSSSLRPKASSLLLGVLGLAVPASADPKPFGTTTTIQLAKGKTLQAAVLADVDGDGADDLIVAAARRGRPGARSLEIRLRKSKGDVFAAEPDFELSEDDMRSDAVAFAVGDVHADSGAEVVLFSAGGAVAWRPRGPADARFEKLLTGSLVWQIPDARDLFHFEAGLRDIDGDGLVDVVLPEPDGYRIGFQSRSAAGAVSFARSCAPRVPDASDGPAVGARKLDAKATRKEMRVQITLGDDDSGPRDLLAVSESVPAPQFHDFDADGKLDLLAQTSRELCVWTQRGDGFAAAPDARYELPVPADRERRLDLSYSSLAADVNGDGRVDCLMLAGDKRAEDVRTQALLYLNGRSGDAESPLFGAQGLPSQLLRIAGFAGSPRLVDVDGDGRLDLVVGAVRLDGAFDAVRAAGKGALDAELYVYANRPRGFSERPDLLFPIAMKAHGLRDARGELLARFFGDVTGDGVRDLLLRDEPERLRLLMTRRAGEKLTVLDKPLWETAVAANAKVVVDEGSREVLVLENDQVLHVRFP